MKNFKRSLLIGILCAAALPVLAGAVGAQASTIKDKLQAAGVLVKNPNGCGAAFDGSLNGYTLVDETKSGVAVDLRSVKNRQLIADRDIVVFDVFSPETSTRIEYLGRLGFIGLGTPFGRYCVLIQGGLKAGLVAQLKKANGNKISVKRAKAAIEIARTKGLRDEDIDIVQYRINGGLGMTASQFEAQNLPLDKTLEVRLDRRRGRDILIGNNNQLFAQKVHG